MLVAYKGNNALDAGYIHAVKIIARISGSIFNPRTFQNQNATETVSGAVFNDSEMNKGSEFYRVVRYLD
jgi:hypothetical protein